MFDDERSKSKMNQIIKKMKFNVAMVMVICIVLACTKTANAETYSVTLTKTTSDYNLSYDTNWRDNSFQLLKEFAGYCPHEPSLMLAGMVYLCFDDNIGTDKDYMKAERYTNGMLSNQSGQLFVMNDDNRSGWTDDFTYSTGVQTIKIEHSVDFVTYKVYFRYDE